MHFRDFFFILVLLLPITTHAQTADRLSFKHLEMNEAGDFVAVSRTKIFVGNAEDGQVYQVYEGTSLDFAVTSFLYLNWGETQGRLEGEFRQTRLALNEDGAFVVASNRNLYYGSVRSKTVDLVYSAEAFTDFQTVAINNNGDVVAVSAEKIVIGNHANKTATVVMDGVPGYFHIYEDYSLTNTASVIAGLQPLDLNQNGQYVACTTSAIFVGNVRTARVEKVVEERYGDYHQVRIADSGRYVVAAADQVYAGIIDF